MAIITDLVVKRIRESVEKSVAETMVRKVRWREHIGWTTHGKPLTTDTPYDWREELLDELYDALQYAEGAGLEWVSENVLRLLEDLETFSIEPHPNSSQ